jgi:hypothetical protein
VRWAVLAVALSGALWLAAAAPTCMVPPGTAVRERIETADVVVLYWTVPAVIEVGRHFAVEALVCTAPGGASVTGVRVDAQMPEHRHGMNYRPQISARGAGRYTAEGLLFHMPGRWQLSFDVDREGRRDRLESDIEVE